MVTDEQTHPDSIAAEFVPHRGPSLASIEIDNEGLVFDEDAGTWHFLNPMAQLIWSCCDGTGSVEEIARDMSDIFGEDYDTVFTGVLETVRQLGQQGLLAGVERTQQVAGHDHDHEGHDHGEENTTEGNEPRFLPVPPSS